MLSGAVPPEYQAIVNTAIDGIVVIDDQGLVQSFNPAAEHMFGYSPDEVLGQNVKLLMPQTDHDQHDLYIKNYRETGVAKIIGIGREVQGRRKDGSCIPLDLAIAEWTSNGQRYFTGIMRDLTERTAAEQETRRVRNVQHELERLNRNREERVAQEVAKREEAQTRTAQAERMQALGQLAGGIAHDFNNLLQVISGAADLISSQLDKPRKIIDVVRTIENAVERGLSVTERLLAFARRSNLRAESLDVAATLDNISRLLAQTLGGSVAVRVEVAAALPMLMADKGTLETVLINLATNGRDAMPQGGILTMSATIMVVTGGDHEMNGLVPGRYIRVAMADAGIGMDAATLARSTQPLFHDQTTGQRHRLGIVDGKRVRRANGWRPLHRERPWRRDGGFPCSSDR